MGSPANSWLAELAIAWAPRIHDMGSIFHRSRTQVPKARTVIQQAWLWEGKDIFPLCKQGAEHQLLGRLAPLGCAGFCLLEEILSMVSGG